MFQISKMVRDLTGQRFGKLAVTEPVGYGNRKQIIWHCKCDCGRTHDVVGSELTRERRGVRSCGCLTRPHGHATRPYSSTYVIWMGMKRRCLNEKDPAYRYYGGRGINVCDRWHNFENFLADMGERPDGQSIDRIDNNKGYEPSNCRWATKQQQSENQRHHRGEQTPSSKLTTEQVIAIREDPRSSSAIANDYDVNRRQISRIKRGERWSHIK